MGMRTGTGVEIWGRSLDRNKDGTGDRNENSFVDENGDKNEGGIGEGGGGLKKHEKPHKN